jgi:hypothetical protein
MAYNNFTLELAQEAFDLQIVDRRFCDSLPPVEPF